MRGCWPKPLRILVPNQARHSGFPGDPQIFKYDKTHQYILHAGDAFLPFITKRLSKQKGPKSQIWCIAGPLMDASPLTRGLEGASCFLSGGCLWLKFMQGRAIKKPDFLSSYIALWPDTKKPQVLRSGFRILWDVSKIWFLQTFYERFIFTKGILRFQTHRKSCLDKIWPFVNPFVKFEEIIPKPNYPFALVQGSPFWDSGLGNPSLLIMPWLWLLLRASLWATLSWQIYSKSLFSHPRKSPTGLFPGTGRCVGVWQC